MRGVAELFADLRESQLLRSEWLLAVRGEHLRERRREYIREYEKRPHVAARRRRYETRPDVVIRRRQRIRENERKRYWSEPAYRELRKQQARERYWRRKGKQ